jgi:predicted transcriptional regulator YheO
MSNLSEHELLLREARKIVEGLARTFAPLCEVVLHDLSDPDHSIVMIENNLSGRKVGDPATELGLARIAESEFPDLLVNYANSFDDGRDVKSTSIGLKDSSGKYVAAICLNVDVSYLTSFSAYLGDLARTAPLDGPSENLKPRNQPEISDFVQTFAANRNKDPRALSSDEKRTLIARMQDEGLLDRRGAADKVAKLIGGSRSSIYYYLEKS